MKKENLYTVMKSNGITVQMAYSDICHALGVLADSQFVKITNRGRISFHVGRPQEIKWLLSATKSAGFVPAKRLVDTAHSC